MRVRIRWQGSASIQSLAASRAQLALILSSLLTPLSLMALSLGCWRLGQDLGWTRGFVIADGIFSHWQVWMGLAVLARSGALSMKRYARGPHYE